MREEGKGLVLIDADEFRMKLGLRSASRFYELAKEDPRFPKPIRKGIRYTRYVLSEVDAYIMEIIKERDSQPQAA